MRFEKFTRWILVLAALSALIVASAAACGDDDDDDMFGDVEDEGEEDSPEIPTPVVSPTPPPTPKQEVKTSHVFTLVEDNGMAVELSVVSAKNGKVYLERKRDEIITIEVQGQKIQVNLTDLARTDPDKVETYRLLS